MPLARILGRALGQWIARKIASSFKEPPHQSTPSIMTFASPSEALLFAVERMRTSRQMERVPAIVTDRASSSASFPMCIVNYATANGIKEGLAIRPLGIQYPIGSFVLCQVTEHTITIQIEAIPVYNSRLNVWLTAKNSV